MELKVFYELVGGDAEKVLDRLPSESMVRRFLGKFPADPSYTDLKASLARREIETAFRAAHTLKGTAGTLGLDTLAAAASALTEALRAADAMPPQTLVEAVETAYQAAIEQIGWLD